MENNFSTTIQYGIKNKFTSDNTEYLVPLRFTHIAIATSDIQKRCTTYFDGNKKMNVLKTFIKIQ